eukprot:scaffold5276_cov124-Isochrysis_galbana.AAC.1
MAQGIPASRQMDVVEEELVCSNVTKQLLQRPRVLDIGGEQSRAWNRTRPTLTGRAARVALATSPSTPALASLATSRSTFGSHVSSALGAVAGTAGVVVLSIVATATAVYVLHRGHHGPPRPPAREPTRPHVAAPLFTAPTLFT